MSHTNKTPNYDLPQFIGTDKASWLGDLNPAFLAIDAGMQANKVAAQAAEVSAGEASALAQSANSVANSANSSANKAIDGINDWSNFRLDNPDETNFIQYSAVIDVNPSLKIASIYNLIEFKSGFTPVLGTSGTVLMRLPQSIFNNTYESTLYFSGRLSIGSPSGTTTYGNAQYIVSGGNIYLKSIGGSVPEGSRIQFSILSRMFYVGRWLK